MQHVCRDTAAEPRYARAGLALAAYQRLRLGNVKWRRLADTIAGPIVRRHRLRNASVRLWLDAVCRLDCGDSQRRRRDRGPDARAGTER